MKYLIITFGCQANRADSERIERKIQMLGHKKASSKKEANLVVINACSVRQSAMDRVYAKIKESAGKKIILAGCLVKADEKKLKSKVSEVWHPDEYFDPPAGGLPVYSSSFSAQVPIMTGCNNFCAYCAVPYTRGRERSRPAKEILKEIKNLVKKNYKEIWLLGQNVNSYHSGKINFPKLLRLVNNIPGKFRIRFTSPHPKDFSGELIKTITGCKKVAKYINLPVQSGDNTVLKQMNRNYTREHYIKLVEKIRRQMPNIAISTDTIVGFPGETKKQFLNTVRLYKQLKFDMAFIAEYSPRPGTAAALTMKDNVPHDEKERRRKILTAVLQKTALGHNRRLVGKTFEILVDSQIEKRLFGRTESNKVVEIIDTNPKPRIGDFARVKILEAGPWKLKGELLKPPLDYTRGKKIIAVIGPTASGKSGLAVEIAKKLSTYGGGEVISADSRQVYKGMNIGTGKITKKEMKSIKHYLLDVANPKKIYTVADFKQNAEEAIKEILKKGKIPIVCGGTGFYINTLLSNLEIPKVAADWQLRKNLEQKTAGELFKMLKKMDGNRAAAIDPKNKRRFIRAIEIAKTLGKVPPLKFDFKTSPKSDFEILWLGIKMPPEELKKRIKKRLLKRLATGMIKEIKNLRKNKVSWKRLDSFGLEYRYVSRYLRGFILKEEMINQLNTAINQYSKRQMTWFKKYAPETRWIKSKNEAFGLVKNFLKN